MAITFPLAFPTITGIAGATLRARSTVAQSISPCTGITQTQVFAGQWWEGEITLPPFSSRASFETWMTFLLSLNGMEGTFLFGDPTGATPRGIATGTPLVNGAAQSDGSLITDGWTAGQTGILLAGDWMQLGTGADSRLYKVLADANSDGSGNATFDIWPDLRGNLIPADNAPIVVTSAKGAFRLGTNERNWDISPTPIYSGITFPIKEAI